MTRLKIGPETGKRLFNANELAEYIGTTQLTVYQMVSKNQIPFVKIGRSTRFDRADIDQWIEVRKHGSTEVA